MTSYTEALIDYFRQRNKDTTATTIPTPTKKRGDTDAINIGDEPTLEIPVVIPQEKRPLPPQRTDAIPRILRLEPAPLLHKKPQRTTYQIGLCQAKQEFHKGLQQHEKDTAYIVQTVEMTSFMKSLLDIVGIHDRYFYRGQFLEFVVNDQLGTGSLVFISYRYDDSED